MSDWRVNGLLPPVVMSDGKVHSIVAKLNVDADSRIDAIREFIDCDLLEVNTGQFVRPRNCSLISAILEEDAQKLEKKLKDDETRNGKGEGKKNGVDVIGSRPLIKEEDLDDPLGR